MEPRNDGAIAFSELYSFQGMQGMRAVFVAPELEQRPHPL